MSVPTLLCSDGNDDKSKAKKSDAVCFAHEMLCYIFLSIIIYLKQKMGGAKRNMKTCKKV